MKGDVRMKWNVVSTVLTFIMCLLLLSMPVFTLEGSPVEDFIIKDDGAELILVSYQGPGGIVVIPDGITEIGPRTFYRQLNLTEIIMPDSVRLIGAAAFQNCTNLTKVRLSENLEIIGERAFGWTDSLANITIPASVKQVGEGAFAPTGLRSVTMMGDVPRLDGRNTFGGSSSLIDVTIHGNVTESGAIGSLTFWGSSALTSLTIYGDIYNNGIDANAFRNHANLTIYGRSDSNLEAFAKENNYHFAVIDDTRPPVSYDPLAEPITVVINGKTIDFDVPPISISGRVLVPLRRIFEEMGADIDWNGATHTVTATKGDAVVVLTIGDISPTIDGQVVPIDQPGMLINWRTLAPLRFVAEAFGGTVIWDSENQTVYITK